MDELFNEDVVEEPMHSGVREELLNLAASKKIKYTVKYIKKASEKTFESIYEDFKRQELDETNEQVAEIMIAKFSEVMIMLKVVDENSNMKNESMENKLLKSDLKSVVGHLTPYIPFVGLVSGGLTVGKHVLIKEQKEEQCSGGSCGEQES